MISSIFLLSGLTPSYAVENGQDATGSGFVVPIMNTETGGGYCSGAVMSSYIVVTAAHCIAGYAGTGDLNIFVGLPGQGMSTAESKANRVQFVYVTPTYSNRPNNAVGIDDIALLIVDNPLPIKTSISVPSKSEMDTMRLQQATLTLIGYGSANNEVNAANQTPNSFIGTFNPQLYSLYPDNLGMISTTGDTCVGDSGAPILNITVAKVTLIGIASGGSLDKYCMKKEANGNYATLFTPISNYANLIHDAHKAALHQMQVKLDESNGKLNLNTTKLETVNVQLSDLENKIISLKTCLISAKKIIQAKKGKLTSNC